LSNVIDSLQHAKTQNNKEVLICFGGVILRANRSTKVDNLGLIAFISPNFNLTNTKIKVYSPDAEYDNRRSRLSLHPASGSSGSFKLNKNKVETPDLSVFLKMKTKFLVFRLAPNFDYTSLVEMLRSVSKVKMIIIELYGIGTAPSSKNKLLKILQICHENGTIVLGVTQNTFGGIRKKYDITTELEKNNMILCGDLTTESACTKLCYLYGKCDGNFEKIKQIMGLNLRGEITM
jgi:L-asparaginase/Glu-tRNA(Gln) amidotransferase subunit D